MILNNKFEIGQEVYTTHRMPIQYDCYVCKGEGKFKHNEYEVKCSRCGGTGKLADTKTLCEAVPHSIIIRSIKASINSAKIQSIKYIFEYSWKNENSVYVKSRPQDMVYETLEEAERAARKNNELKIAKENEAISL